MSTFKNFIANAVKNHENASTRTESTTRTLREVLEHVRDILAATHDDVGTTAYEHGHHDGLRVAVTLVDSILNDVPRRYLRGDRVRATMNAGFHKGATGVVEFVEPAYTRVWVLRDNSGTPVYYHPDELEFE